MLVDGPTQGTSLNVSGFPATITAGVAGSFTVTAKNADGSHEYQLPGHRPLHQQRSPGRPARQLHLHRRRRGRAHLQRHPEDGGQPVHHRQ